MDIRAGRFMPATKKARLLLAIFALGIVGAGILWNRERPQEKQDQFFGAQALVREAELQKLQQDSDQDGLKDWEEGIFRTDPNNPDTDGDGTPDGEEVKQRRDPVKAAPDDALEIKPIERGEVGENGFRNLTEEFTRTFAAGPIGQVVAGQKPIIDTRIIESYTDQLLRVGILNAAGVITEKQIKLIPDTSVATMKAYVEAVDTLWQKNFGSLNGTEEIFIMMKALEEENYQSLAKLEPYAARYQNTITSLLSVPVPPFAKEFHLELLNLLTKILFATERMRNAEQDPLAAIMALQERAQLELQFKQFMDAFQIGILDTLEQLKQKISR